MTGMTRMRVLASQYWTDESSRILELAPLSAVQIPVRPLISAMRNAINPRLEHPRTSTGVDPIIRKANGRRAGRMMWFNIRLII